MTLPYRLLPEAEQELERAFEWYEQQKAGLGARFLAAVRRVIRGIARQPKMHAVVYRDVRKAVVARFPFIVLYRPLPRELLVVSVFHTSRDPLEWQSRV
jgi:plasmid stabilization system protein ParE